MASYFDEHDCEPLGEGQAPNHTLSLARLLLQYGMSLEWWSEVQRIFGNEMSTPPTSKKVIESLPTRKVTASESEDSLKCTICLGEFEENNEIKTLPCNHQFHSSCILPWLEKVNTCPMCRTEFPTDNPEYEEYRAHKARQKQRDFELDSLHNSMFG
ncbi:E3 ubiquitin-protein ligase RNF181 [Octopus bimaculoides]|uniref:RING-type E3 ubiquitin transferase n=2 Tax=Octopus bimaculoides TaxID=37653 RepID=A0A0L8FTI7_OCTBM|nr:E3 ubiquitin-protein ligase RNF181 [Octopus bimaculoides]|eukprot:XP_014787081.1 PREDICTED: E3 ubiquitin-protein ligase RNF181-like [Octopus bimaculoides]